MDQNASVQPYLNDGEVVFITVDREAGRYSVSKSVNIARFENWRLFKLQLFDFKEIAENEAVELTRGSLRYTQMHNLFLKAL